MKKSASNVSLFLLAATSLFTIAVTGTSCKKTKINPTPPVVHLRTKVYTLHALDSSKLTGMVTFSEKSDKSVTVTVLLHHTVKKETYHLAIFAGLLTDSATVQHPDKISFALPVVTGTGGDAAAGPVKVDNFKLFDAHHTVIRQPSFYEIILNFTGYFLVYYDKKINKKTIQMVAAHCNL